MAGILLGLQTTQWNRETTLQHLPFKPNAIAALCAAGCVTLACQAAAAEAGAAPSGEAAGTPVVIVTGSRAEHDSAEFPAAIDVVGTAQIRDAQMRVNASEALVAVPGLVIQNRQN
jgi:iron complex outermembrane receptor protein